LAELAMNDPATQVRLAAIEALGESGPLALPVLLELSRAADGDLAGAALIAVGATGQAAGPARLSEAIQSQSREKQIQAARGLARSKSREAVESLRAAAVGSDAPVATEAIVALGQLGIPEAAAALIEVARLPCRRDKCIDALAAMSAAAVPALAQGLLSEELDARRAIVEALARFGQPHALAALEAALVDREPGVRHAALSALAHIRRESRTADSAPACESKP